MNTKTGLWGTRIFLVLIAMTLFIACQKDDEISPVELLDIQESQLKVTTSKITSDEIPKIMDYLSTKSNSRGQFTIVKSNDDKRSNEPNLIIGELQTQEILKITNQNNKSNYTFSLISIESNDPTAKSFFNLIIKETSRGLLPFIVEYRPDINWIPNYRDPEDFSEFTGDIIYYSIDGIFSAKITMNLGAFTSINQRTPCEDDNSDGNPGGDESPDGNNPDGNNPDGNNTDGDSTDGDSSDGDSSGEGDWVLVCETVILVIDSNACGGDPCGISFEHCEVQPQNSHIPPSDGLFRNPCLPDTEDICHQDNTEPCPNGCNADMTGCAEESENNEEDDNPTIGVIHPSENLIAHFIEEGIIDENLNICHKDILSELKELEENDIRRIITRFSPTSSYNIEFKTETLGAGVFGTTNWKVENGAIQPYNYLIRISDLPSEGTDLHLAVTMMHELIHAHFLSLADDLLITGDSDLEDGFPELWDWYVLNLYGGNAGSVHHETLANLYVDSIARALQEYDTGTALPLNQTPAQLYSDLAWGGLTGTDIYDEMHPPMSDSRIRIGNRIFAEAFNVTSGDETPAGSPCN